ncbi:MAG: TIGR03619 family F420-dependent LLM class oxidoreductase, partial [Chloroflexota bacterium]
MDYGFRVPVRGALTAPEHMSALARHAEALGFAFISSPDHVVMPAATESEYPYGGTAAFQVKTNEGEFLEELTVLSFIAGQTSRVRLLTSVMVVPYRQPVLAAKMFATLDYLSQGRVVVGCGVGWLREEFEALNAPPYEDRGAATDEYIRVFKELWTNPRPTFEGKYVRFPALLFAPRPVPPPHP